MKKEFLPVNCSTDSQNMLFDLGQDILTKQNLISSE